MKFKLALLAFLLMWVAAVVDAQKAREIPNPSIDMKGYLRVAEEAAKYREKRRLTEVEFIEMILELGVVILDARSKQKYDELHFDEAVNLSFPDITVDSLAALFPNKDQKILI